MSVHINLLPKPPPRTWAFWPFSRSRVSGPATAPTKTRPMAGGPMDDGRMGDGRIMGDGRMGTVTAAELAAYRDATDPRYQPVGRWKRPMKGIMAVAATGLAAAGTVKLATDSGLRTTIKGAFLHGAEWIFKTLVVPLGMPTFKAIGWAIGMAVTPAGLLLAGTGYTAHRLVRETREGWDFRTVVKRVLITVPIVDLIVNAFQESRLHPAEEPFHRFTNAVGATYQDFIKVLSGALNMACTPIGLTLIGALYTAKKFRQYREDQKDAKKAWTIGRAFRRAAVFAFAADTIANTFLEWAAHPGEKPVFRLVDAVSQTVHDAVGLGSFILDQVMTHGGFDTIGMIYLHQAMIRKGVMPTLKRDPIRLKTNNVTDGMQEFLRYHLPVGVLLISTIPMAVAAAAAGWLVAKLLDNDIFKP